MNKKGFVMLAVRPEIKEMALRAANNDGKFLYRWLEEAIKEKVARDEQKTN